MKAFKLHGNTAYWLRGLSFNALNLNTLENDVTSPIPTDKRVYVTLVSNVYRVEGTHDEVLKGEISESDKNALLAEIKTNTPDFILSLNDKVIGYANYKLRKGASDTAANDTAKKYVDVAILVSTNLDLNYNTATGELVGVVAAKNERAAHLNGYTRVAIIDHAEHRLYVEDIPDTILESKYNGEEDEYIKDNYTFEGEWSWDYIVDTEYIPHDEDTTIDVDFRAALL